MNRKDRNQTPSKETRERVRFEREELERTLSPDLDFPQETNGTGGQK
jgi:hypothetical protein